MLRYGHISAQNRRSSCTRRNIGSFCCVSCTDVAFLATSSRKLTLEGARGGARAGSRRGFSVLAERLEPVSEVVLVALVGFVWSARGAHPHGARPWGYAREKSPHKPHQRHLSGLNRFTSEYRGWWGCLGTGLKRHHFRPFGPFWGGFFVYRGHLGRY